MSRAPEGTGASFGTVLFCAALFAFGLWSAPYFAAFIESLDPARPVRLECPRPDADEGRRAAHFAGIVVGCLNGGSITEGGRTVECVEPQR